MLKFKAICSLTIRTANGKVLTTIGVGSAKDVDIAVDAAHEAFTTKWGLLTPGSERGRLLENLARLMEQHQDDISALEALDNGKNTPLRFLSVINSYLQERLSLLRKLETSLKPSR